MTFEQFKQDVLEHGPDFAIRCASVLGVKGSQLAAWLSRLTVKPRPLALL